MFVCNIFYLLTTFYLLYFLFNQISSIYNIAFFSSRLVLYYEFKPVTIWLNQSTAHNLTDHSVISTEKIIDMAIESDNIADVCIRKSCRFLYVYIIDHNSVNLTWFICLIFWNFRTSLEWKKNLKNKNALFLYDMTYSWKRVLNLAQGGIWQSVFIFFLLFRKRKLCQKRKLKSGKIRRKGIDSDFLHVY